MPDEVVEVPEVHVCVSDDHRGGLAVELDEADVEALAVVGFGVSDLALVQGVVACVVGWETFVGVAPDWVRLEVGMGYTRGKQHGLFSFRGDRVHGIGWILGGVSGVVLFVFFVFHLAHGVAIDGKEFRVRDWDVVDGHHFHLLCGALIPA